MRVPAGAHDVCTLRSGRFPRRCAEGGSGNAPGCRVDDICFTASGIGKTMYGLERKNVTFKSASGLPSSVHLIVVGKIIQTFGSRSPR